MKDDNDQWVSISLPLCKTEKDLFISIFNQGIDGHGEAFVKSTAKIVNGRLEFDFHASEIHIILRRLREENSEAANSWARDIEFLTLQPLHLRWGNIGRV